MSSQPQPSSQLISVTATVKAFELTPLGHLACVLDADGQHYSAIGDPIVATTVDLAPGVPVRAVLLRLRRAAPDAIYQWQLLCCRVLPAHPSSHASSPTTVHLEGSQA